jgi:uncharacterized oxidoreductase
MTPTGNTILVTGGGSGIGRALAQRWADRGNQVIVAGRRADALAETIAGRPDMASYTVDVDDPAALAHFAAQVVAEHPELNVLVNNAGIMRAEDVTASRDLSGAEGMVATNILGPIRMIDALIDHLATRPDAVIVNVTSGLGFVPLPAAATYSATKAFIHSYTVSLRERLRGRIELIELAPPGVQTDLTPGQATRPGYQPLDSFADEVIGLFEQQPTPEEILVENVRHLRFAERDGTVADKLAMFGGYAAPNP